MANPVKLQETAANNIATEPGNTKNVTIPATVAGSCLLINYSQAAAATGILMTPSASGASFTTPAAVTAATNGPPPVGLISGTNSSTYFCYAFNVAAGITTVTLTWAAASKIGVVNITEWSNVAAASAVDVSGGIGRAANASSPFTEASPTLTTLNANDVVVFWMACPQTLTLNTASSAPTTGWNALTAGNNTIKTQGHYQVFSATGAYNVAYDPAATTAIGTVGIALKAAVGDAPMPPIRLANKFVGPMALRQNFRQPQNPQVNSPAPPSTPAGPGGNLPTLGVG